MKKESGQPQQWVSRSASETKRIGRELARRLMAGNVVALYGELGAGKTTLVQGIAEGLGVRSGGEVSSPTFVVIHEYVGKFKIHHLDWYRLKKVKGVDAAMAEECFYSNGVTLVEWPERGEDLLPQKHIEIRIRHQGPTIRAIEMTNK